MFKYKEEQYNRIFQLIERVENPYGNLINEQYDPSGLLDKYFDSSTGNIFSDEFFKDKKDLVDVISNATDEIKECCGQELTTAYWWPEHNCWIVRKGTTKYLIYVSPGKSTMTPEERKKYDENLKSGSGKINKVLEIKDL
jgi:hypothetical protein